MIERMAAVFTCGAASSTLKFDCAHETIELEQLELIFQHAFES